VNSTRKYKYESSYAFAEVESEGKITQFCANFQHWKTRDLPASAAEAVSHLYKQTKNYLENNFLFSQLISLIGGFIQMKRIFAHKGMSAPNLSRPSQLFPLYIEQ
jgi:hypothetical protein